MRLIVDDDIPFIKGVLEPFFDVKYIKGGEISKERVRDASAVIVRTRTICDESLLEGSKVKAIFSATIGSDHIDVEYCEKRGIEVHTAPGCNAYGVVQYVITSLFALMSKKGDSFKGRCFGIVGAGNVGERLAGIVESLGVRVMRCDPPKSLTNSNKKYYDLAAIARECDIISLHVPLDDFTKGMISYDFFETIKSGVYFVNSSRGDVVDEEALLQYNDKLAGLVLDVWRNEPWINKVLVEKAGIATPHIAGYSLEGKRNATEMTVKSIGNYYGITELLDFYIALPEVDLYEDGLNQCRGVESVSKSLLEYFPLWDCVSDLKSNPERFEKLRSDFKLRREPPFLFYANMKHLLCSAK